LPLIGLLNSFTS